MENAMSYFYWSFLFWGEVAALILSVGTVGFLLVLLNFVHNAVANVQNFLASVIRLAEASLDDQLDERDEFAADDRDFDTDIDEGVIV